MPPRIILPKAQIVRLPLAEPFLENTPQTVMLKQKRKFSLTQIPAPTGRTLEVLAWMLFCIHLLVVVV